jgi:lipase
VSYTTFDVPVSNGESVHVGKWGGGPNVVIAAHGLTENHLCFAAVANHLEGDITLIAVDLRGRGRSQRRVGVPSGLAVHADDLAGVLDHVGVDRATVMGYSFGGFVAVFVAERHADRVNGLVLIDGGLPIEPSHVSENMTAGEEAKAVAGPAVERLEMTFETREAYLDFWRSHPAFASDWNEYAEQMFDYDLVGSAPRFRPSIGKEALVEAKELRSDALRRALTHISCPVAFLRAPLGLLNEEPPLYPRASIENGRKLLSGFNDVLVPEVNHFTIVLSDRGAAAIVRATEAQINDPGGVRFKPGPSRSGQ